MAGIGFELRKLLASRSLGGALRAYAYAGVISSGPWIISILSIIVLHTLLRPILTEHDLTLFSTTITHAYALALILTGGLQFVLTRYAADQFSANRPENVLPSCFAALTLTAIIAAIAGSCLFGLLTPESPVYKIAATALLVAVSCIFVVANYLSVLHRYKRIVAGFAIGYVVACTAAWFAARAGGAGLAVSGFAAGHLLLLVCLLVPLQREIGSPILASWNFMRHFRIVPELAFCGLFYNIGIWIDKILFWWFSEQNVQVSGVLHASLAYDISIYLSLLSIVPGLTLFFLKLETAVADGCSQFFDRINHGGTLAQIEAARDDLIGSLRAGFVNLMLVQGIVTIALLICAESLGQWLGLGAIQIGIFRITLVGAFLLVVFLSLLTVLFYFDDRKGALWACAVFAFGNAGLSFATLLANEAWYGFGFVVAAGAAMTIAAIRANQRAAVLEYHVFTPKHAKL